MATVGEDATTEAPSSFLSNTTIFARLNELDKWRQEEELDKQAWAAELERQQEEDEAIAEERARIKEKFEQRKAERRRRVLQTRNEMDTLLGALKENLTRDLSDLAGLPVSNALAGAAAASILQAQTGVVEPTDVNHGLQSTPTAGSLFRPVNQNQPPSVPASSQPKVNAPTGQPKRKRQESTDVPPIPRQKRKYTRRVPVNGGSPVAPGLSPSYSHRASQPEGPRGEQEGAYWCERRDKYNRGIWTHPRSGIEYYLQCPKCQKKEFKSLKGLKIHYTLEHEKRGITVDNIELALDSYGVPVDPALASTHPIPETETSITGGESSQTMLRPERTTIGEVVGDMYSDDEEPQDPEVETPAQDDDGDSIAVVSTRKSQQDTGKGSTSNDEDSEAIPPSGGRIGDPVDEDVVSDPSAEGQTANSTAESQTGPQSNVDAPQSTHMATSPKLATPNSVDRGKSTAKEKGRRSASKRESISVLGLSDSNEDDDNEASVAIVSPSQLLTGWKMDPGSRRTTRARFQ